MMFKNYSSARVFVRRICWFVFKEYIWFSDFIILYLWFDENFCFILIRKIGGLLEAFQTHKFRILAIFFMLKLYIYIYLN